MKRKNKKQLNLIQHSMSRIIEGMGSIMTSALDQVEANILLYEAGFPDLINQQLSKTEAEKLIKELKHEPPLL